MMLSSSSAIDARRLEDGLGGTLRGEGGIAMREGVLLPAPETRLVEGVWKPSDG